MIKFKWETEFKKTEIGEIPREWEEKRVEEFYKLMYGITTSSKGYGNCRLLRMTDIGEEDINIETIPYAKIDEQELKKYYLDEDEDDLVISRIANVGAIGHIRGDLLQKLDKPLIFGSYLLKFVKQPGKQIYNRFVYYFFISHPMQTFIESLAEGSTRPNTNAKVVSKFPLYYPPPPEQTRITTVLSWFDDLIENKKKQNEILEKTAMAIFKSWFVDFEPFKDEEFVYSEELGKEIPRGWEVEELGEFVSTQYGFTASGEETGKIKLLRIKDINKYFVIDWDSVPFCNIINDIFPKYQLKNMDIVISRIGDIGKVAIVENPPLSVFASYLIRLKIKNHKLTPYYLYYWLKAPDYQEYIQGVAEGSTRPNTNAEVIKVGPILIPPPSLIEKFEEVVFPIRSKIILNQKQIMVLRKMRDALLPKLMLRV